MRIRQGAKVKIDRYYKEEEKWFQNFS
jgi:hypothetical protein